MYKCMYFLIQQLYIHPIQTTEKKSPFTKVINLVSIIAPFFHYNEMYRIYVSIYRVRTVLNFKK